MAAFLEDSDRSTVRARVAECQVASLEYLLAALALVGVREGAIRLQRVDETVAEPGPTLEAQEDHDVGQGAERRHSALSTAAEGVKIPRWRLPPGASSSRA